MPAQWAASRVLKELGRIRRLVFNETVRVDDLPTVPGALDALTLREVAALFLPRDDLEPVSNELEAGQRPRLLLRDHVPIQRRRLLGRVESLGDLSVQLGSSPPRTPWSLPLSYPG